MSDDIVFTLKRDVDFREPVSFTFEGEALDVSSNTYTLKCVTEYQGDVTAANFTLDTSSSVTGMIVINLSKEDRELVTVSRGYLELYSTDEDGFTSSELSARVFFV